MMILIVSISFGYNLIFSCHIAYSAHRSGWSPCLRYRQVV